MAGALKLYLFLLEPDKDCDVLVYRTVEELQEKWACALLNNGQAAALVHVGCLRPRLEDVGHVLRVHPGRVLLSEPARWALPREIALAARLSQTCNYAGVLDELPVYLATTGWGYEVAPSQRPPQSAAPRVAALVKQTRVPVGWVAMLGAAAPELAEVLAVAGVATDEDYVTWRIAADPGLSRRCDRARFKIRVASLSKVEQEEPTVFCAILPREILAMPVEALVVSARLINFFGAQGINVVGDLSRWTRAELQQVKNLGRKSIAELPVALTSAVDLQRFDAAAVPEGVLPPASTETLAERLERGMRLVEPRAQGVLRSRLAYQVPFRVLEQIGAELGVTRERARQLEEKGLKTLRRVALMDNPLPRELRRSVTGARDPVYLDLLCATDAWFSGIREDTAERVIEAFCEDGEFSVIHVDGRAIVTRVNQADWEKLKQEVLAYLVGNLGVSREDVELHILSTVHARGVPELRGLLSAHLKPKLHYGFRGDGQEILSGVGSEGRNAVATVLLEADTPLHITEIARRASILRGDHVSLGVVRRWLSELDAGLFARGTYGTEAHISGSVKKEDIVNFVDDLLQTDGAQRQWHVWEIFEALVSDRADLCDGLDPYILNILMRRLPPELCEYQGRFVWTFKGRGLDSTNRIDIADACIAALIEAGRPMTTEEVKRAVTKARGLHPGLMLSQDGRLLRVAPGVWGLRDRDTGLSAEAQREVLDGLYVILVDKGRELHVSEVQAALAEKSDISGETGYVVCSLAQGDSRFRWNRGQLLGLREWGGARRSSVSQAVRETISEIDVPIAFEDIWMRVCQLAERQVPRWQVSSQLQVSGLRFDEKTDRWLSARSAGDEDADEFEVAESALS